MGYVTRGDIVLIGNPLANRDPRVFPDPDCFIVDRKPNNHLGLGQGIHRCLGAHLIALEAKIVVKEFLDRIPDFALDETIGAQWIAISSGIRGSSQRFRVGVYVAND